MSLQTTLRAGGLLIESMAAAADFERSMAKLVATLAEIDLTAIQRLVDAIDGYDEHHPKPLPINGHAYARRRRNR